MVYANPMNLKRNYYPYDVLSIVHIRKESFKQQNELKSDIFLFLRRLSRLCLVIISAKLVESF